ncbi:uncharacterized protein LOC143198828 [Rhynchophorus ferrugineus]|uniref:uncharacterized protein LOC143198828 n=1 Tax=Rhynchophorus ferrugineus TaxID=354439 RepID=UPI003FCC624E
MDLKNVLLTILKILISTALLNHYVAGNSLMGGHLDNKNQSDEALVYDYEYDDASAELSTEKVDKIQNKSSADSEEIPDPSALVRPGYNLPENIFNRGKPFYVEKDPSTGQIDFNNKSPSFKADSDDLYEYVSDEPSDDIYDKKNIDRKDGSISGYGSHRPNDVNQLTTNFHDFLNLPVKYNPDKYVYPLISNSYASTKIQGSVNKFHNHKDTFGVPKTTTTKRPPPNPTYHTTGSYFTPRTTQRTMATTRVTTTSTTTTTTTTPRPTTKRIYPELTTKPVSLLNSGMSHPSFNEDYEYYDSPTEPIKHTTKSTYIPSTSTLSTTTKKEMSLFEQLFGSYDDEITTTSESKVTNSPIKLPTKFDKNIVGTTTPKTEKSTQVNKGYYPNIHAGPQNFQSEMNTEYTNYEYNDEDDYHNPKLQDNIAVENKVHSDDTLTVEPLSSSKINKTSESTFHIKPTYFTVESSTVTSTTPIKVSTTTGTTEATTSRVTSLPLGDNHISAPINRDPIIVATQNLREKLNSEKVRPPPVVIRRPYPSEQQKPINTMVPSTSNIHIAPDQDTVSFVVGHHQSVGDPGQYVGTALKESPFDESPFRPLFGHEASYSSNTDTNGPQIQSFKPAPPQETVGSAVTIQPLQHSEASLTIGMPVNGIKQIPGQVMDAHIEHEGTRIQFPNDNIKNVAFPDDKKPIHSNLIPPRTEQTLPTPLPTREVLKLNSKPMYHQLPSDLTPPRESDIKIPPPTRPSDRPMRPPWDPRPGHFYNGKPEYVRPPRPRPEVAYKRIDNLPNILPQFRPNVKYHHTHSPPYLYDQRLNRQPLLERPSNRPIGYFEKMMPPPPVPYYSYQQKNIIKGPPPSPPSVQIEERRPIAQALQSLDNQTPIAEDRIINENPRRPLNSNPPEINLYQTPPNIQIVNRRHSDGTEEVETLQMIQAKSEKEKDIIPEKQRIEEVNGDTLRILAQEAEKLTNDNNKTIYRVYPVESTPFNPEFLSGNSDGVVIGTRAELPLPPSKIENDFDFHKQDRNDAPILKPHPKIPGLSNKSEFPYPLERPEPVLTASSVPDNKLEDVNTESFNYNNQWNTVGENVETRIVNGNKKIHNPNQISVTLKTYTEKPIAIAYTPTDPTMNSDKYSMPNYGSPVIPEIRPSITDGSEKKVITKYPLVPSNHKYNHKIDSDIETVIGPDQQDFQAPFQASVKLDAATNHGWSVVRDKAKTTPVEETETTTIPLATTSEFDIENFKPQLIGGFQPLYSFPDTDNKNERSIAEREE